MEREVNLDDVVKYLSRAFSKAAAKATKVIGNKAFRVYDKRKGVFTTTTLYDYQVEYCYLMNDIRRAPRYISTKSIQRANELIAELEQEAK